MLAGGDVGGEWDSPPIEELVEAAAGRLGLGVSNCNALIIQCFLDDIQSKTCLFFVIRVWCQTPSTPSLSHLSHSSDRHRHFFITER